MAGSSYIADTEVGAYGLVGMPRHIIARASSMIDSILKRPDGLIWLPDAAGWPCYMAARNPSLSLTIPGPVLAGTNVTVNLPPGAGSGFINDSLLGDAVVLDRASVTTPEAMGRVESCTVISFTLSGQLIFGTVQYDHPGPVTLDFGLAITEERSLPSQRSITRVSQWPVVRIISGLGRYGYGRRSDQASGYADEINLLASYQSFGGPPAWERFDAPSTSLNPMTGEMWVPAGILLSYYSDVRIRYLGGWPVGSLPEPIKLAAASLALAMRQGNFPGNALRVKAGSTDIQRATASVLDDDTLRQLQPFTAHTFL